MATAPEVLGGRFEIVEWLGEGSLSVVHAARDLVTGREVAVKVASATTSLDAVRRRFEREAAALSVIASPHVVELFSAGTLADGRPFLVLERLRGRDLEEVLLEHGPLDPARVVRLVGHAAAALELAHGLGIVHRDLKPANLFLHVTESRELVVKVLDFGMVVDVGGPTERGRDAFGGTPMYMAPEQVRGQLTRIGPATDTWALGILTLTLLTAERYWTGEATADLLEEIQTAPVEPPSLRWRWLPRAFDAWFARSTQRVPERRYRSVAEQAAGLARALEGARGPGRGRGAKERVPAPSLAAAGESSGVIGRQRERGEIEQALAAGAVVTLTGTGGIGKTRLAEAVLGAVADRYPDGAWLVPLGPGANADAILAGIEHALDLEPDSAVPAFEHVVASLEQRELLIALDGIEQVRGGAEILDRLRQACPRASWLATSRLPLGLAAERCIGVEPLEVPATEVGADEAQTFAAVELFLRRTREASPAFALAPENVEDVVAICRAVEGFPLGLELAAAQMARATPAEICAALAREAQADGQRSAVRAAVAWSYGLLAPDEQAILRHLALLPDGLTFERARVVLGHLSADPTRAVLRLVSSHIVSWSHPSISAGTSFGSLWPDEPRRIVMLDTVRELCRDLSRAAGEEEALWAAACRHAAEVARGDPSDPAGQQAWLARADAEHENLRAVLSHLLDADPAAAMELAANLAWYWYVRGHYAEGGRWLEQAIERSGAATGEALIRALHGAGRFALLRCRYQRARDLLDRARGLAHLEGDLRGEADAVQLLGSVARERGDYPQARALHQHGLLLWERLGDVREAARARNYLTFAAWLGDPRGDPGAAQAEWWRERAERDLRALGDPEGIVWSLLNAGAIRHYRGDREAAREVLGRAFEEAIAARFHEGIAWSLNLIGLASLDRGELFQARAQLGASLRVHRRLGDLWRCASVLETLAAAAVTADRPDRAAIFLGAADAVRAVIGAPVPACERALHAATGERGHEALGDRFGAARERGRRTPLEEVVALTREVV